MWEAVHSPARTALNGGEDQVQRVIAQPPRGELSWPQGRAPRGSIFMPVGTAQGTAGVGAASVVAGGGGHWDADTGPRLGFLLCRAGRCCQPEEVPKLRVVYSSVCAFLLLSKQHPLNPQGSKKVLLGPPRSNMMRCDNPVNAHEIDIKLEVARILSVTVRYNFFLCSEIHFASKMIFIRSL